MKLYTTLLIILVITSCSQNQHPPANKPAIVDNAKIEKNKQTAILNEVSELTRAAQRLDRQGRDMDSYRLASGAESQRTCSALMEDRQREVNDLEAKIKNVPDTYSTRLTPIIPDLNECVSCSKKAMSNCVKTRAAVNALIKELYPQ